MDGVERAGAVAVACLVAALAFAVPAAAERPGGPPGPGDPAPAPAAPPAPPMAEGSSLTSFYFGKGGQISPVPPPEGTNGQSSIAQGVSVHAAEALVKQTPASAVAKTATVRAPVEKTNHVQGIEDELRQKLAVQVDVRLTAEDRGQIVLRFESSDDFERLLEVLRR